MAVRFILGRSGTGKTSFCIKAIVDALVKQGDNQALILLVPEQATYQAERAIVTDKRISGYNRLSVLSFDRLGFLLSGKNTASPRLSRIGQQMIISRILREHQDELKILTASATHPGLSSQMAETIAELHRYANTAEDIDRLVDKLAEEADNNLTALKFADIGLVFKEYLKFIEGKYIDPDAQLSQALEAVAEAGFVKGAKLWVDGFSSFTGSELAILVELLKTTADAQIAICLDPSNINVASPDGAQIDPAGVFSPTEDTYTTLVEIVNKCKLKLAEPIVLEKAIRFSASPELGHIECQLFKLEPAKIKALDNVRIVSASNVRAEVQFVATQIRRLVKQENLRYRDIAVIASDIGMYEPYVRAYFDDYRIAFFIDKRKALNQHPVIGLICSAFEAVVRGFLHRDVFAYLKSALAAIEDCDIDLLENYCLAFGVEGKEWENEQAWDFATETDGGFDQQRINQIRSEAIGPLLALRKRFYTSDGSQDLISADEFTQAVFDFLDQLNVRQRIAGWIEEAAQADDYATVDEHRQFYERMVDIFDELVEVFAGQQMTYQDFFAIVNSAFSQVSLAFIPPTLDQVLVGSVERSRHPDLKAVFLIGATQKQFPTPISYTGLLTDSDRMIAESADFALAATAAQRLAQRQYLAYIAFTRASQYLFVSYPLADNKGSALARSQFLTNLESLFDGLNEETVTTEQRDIEQVHTKAQLTELICSQLGKDSAWDSAGILSQLLNYICSDDKLAELGSVASAAIEYDNSARLERGIVERFFENEIKTSATRLGTYAACPYKYFAQYLLELQQRQEFKFEPLDLGIFYHQVLDLLLKQLKKENKDFATTTDTELLEFLSSQISRLLKENTFVSNFRLRSEHNKFIVNSAIERLDDFVLAMAQMVRAGSFVPSESEVLFGQAGDAGGEYKIALAKGKLLILRGKIDRIDIADVGGRRVSIVFDYKRTGRSFSWSRLYYGLDMQLPVYMLAMRSASKLKQKSQKVIGAFYLPVEAAIEQATIGEFLAKEAGFNHKAKGLFNGEFFGQLDKKATAKNNMFYSFHVTKDGQPYGHYGNRDALKPNDFEKVLDFAGQKIVELAEQIVSGKIDVTPYKLTSTRACQYCEYKSVCRFDWQINQYNVLRSLGKIDVLEEIGAVDG